MNKFWKWKKQKVINQDGGEGVERVLELRGTIASESWYDDDVTPKMFKDELLSGNGDITVYINSPGGDCVAAAQMWLERASPRSSDVYSAKREFTENDRLFCHKQGLLFMEAAAMGLRMEDFTPLYMRSQLAGVVDHYFCSSFQNESDLAKLLQMPVLVDNPRVIIETLYWIEDIISKTNDTDNKSLILSKAYQAESCQPPKALLELSGEEIRDIDALSFAYWLGYMYRCECIMHDESSRMVYGAFDEKTMLTVYKEISDSPLNKENLSDCAVAICDMLDQLLITKIWKGKNYKDCI